MSDSEEEYGNEVEVLQEGWGKKASDYYGGSDVEDLSEDEDRLEMEKEAEAIARKRQEKLDRTKSAGIDDFASSSDEDGEGKEDEDEEEEEEVSEDGKEDSEEREDAKKNLRKAMMELQSGEEKLKLNASLTEDQRAVLIKKQSPELMMLLKEFHDEIKFLNETLLPVQEIVSSNEKVFTAYGAEYLQNRIQFANAYCCQLTFYLHLKQKQINGGDVEYLQAHPVFESILEMKQEKEKYNKKDEEVFKSDFAMALQMNATKKSTKSKRAEKSFKKAPQPEELSDDDDSRSASGSNNEASLPLSGGSSKSTASSGFKKQEQKKSPVKMESLQKKESPKKQEPTLADAISAAETKIEKPAAADLKSRMKEKIAAVLAAREKKNQPKQKRSAVGVVGRCNSVSLPTDMPDFDPTLGVAETGDKKRLNQYMHMGQALAESAGTKKRRTDETEVDYKKRDTKARDDYRDIMMGEMPAENGNFADPLDNPDLDSKTRTKLLRQKEHEEAIAKKEEKEREKRIAKGPSAEQKKEIEVDDEAARMASKQILQNRGLMRIRPKKDRNARVKNRLKYEKAVKNRKTLVHEVRESENVYAGEATGLKSTVVKSHKLR